MTHWLRFRSKLRLWAYENALTLTFLALMFGVTWILMIVLYATGGQP